VHRRMVLGGLASVLLAPRVARPSSTDEEGVKAVLERLAAAVRAKDVDRIVECFVPDASLVVFDVSGNYRGPAPVRKAFAEFLSTIPGPVHFELREEAITASATVAFAHAIEHMRATNKMGKAMDATVRNTRCLRKVKGKWLIAHEHVSMPVDQATGRVKVAPNA
jgi:uncharacterized protein (TIGR02246 family)